MNDGYTQILTDKINNWGIDKIYEMEDDIYGMEDRVPEIIDYLKDIHFSMPLGIALRRYLCERFSTGFNAADKSYYFEVNGRTLIIHNYLSESYNIETDDIPECVDIFNDINARFNTGKNGELLLNITKAEVRRLFRSSTDCIRKKMFEISFALHMTSEYTTKFLTDILAEQTYNYREPKEIIACFCQSNDAYNSYETYLELLERYQKLSAELPKTAKQTVNYTSFARNTVTRELTTSEQLMEFLTAHVADFHGYSQTAYNEFASLYIRASGYLNKGRTNAEFTGLSAQQQIDEVTGYIEKGVLINPEQLAKEMLACIPRATTEREKNGKKIISNDFIPIYNGESGQDSKKVKTTELPKKITMNLPVSDRLWDLLKQIKPVDRKDLVFMKFYVFSLYLQEKEVYSAEDYFVFSDECNSMLVRCGMSRLYPGNRFENLIMLSLLASNPFEMFENIIEYSFMNEPTYEKEE